MAMLNQHLSNSSLYSSKLPANLDLRFKFCYIPKQFYLFENERRTYLLAN